MTRINVTEEQAAKILRDATIGTVVCGCTVIAALAAMAALLWF